MNKKIKILQINKLYYPWIGGVEKIIQQISEGVGKKNDCSVTVLCCQPKGASAREEINGVKVFRAASFGIFWGLPVSFDFFLKFRKESQKADIIDLHHPFPLADLALLLFRPKAKITVHYHSDIVRQKIFNFLLNPLVNNTLKRADRIIVSNPNLIRYSPIINKFKEKCEIIPFGTDISVFQKIESAEVEKIKKKYGKFVLFVGRLNYYKGVIYLIRAAKKIEANILIVGSGPEREKLKEEVKNLGVEEKVFFLDPLEAKELVKIFQSCSIFILPSIYRSEAFGIVLIEAMACGKPLISTELGTGTSFVNQNNVTGFVIPPKESEALAEAVNKIIKDENLNEKFGKNSMQRAQSEFSIEKMIERNYLVYKEFFVK